MPQCPVEFIGMIGTSNASEIRTAPHGSGRDRQSFQRRRDCPRSRSTAGFDRVLIGYFSVAADGFQVLPPFAAHSTERLGLLLAHRPGFVAPTLAARQLASPGPVLRRAALAVHVITGGSRTAPIRRGMAIFSRARSGDARTDDYLDVVKKAWTSPRALRSRWATYYRDRERGHVTAAVRCLQTPQHRRSTSADLRTGRTIEVAGKQHADVYALWGESLAAVADTIARVRAAAARHGRHDHVRFSLSLRPILGRTEDEGLGARAPDLGPSQGFARRRRVNRPDLRAGPGSRRDLGRTAPQNAGSQRLLAEAARGPQWSTSGFGPNWPR